MKRIVDFFLLTFILNFIWEISQAFLYSPHYAGIGGLIKVHIRASLGDVLMVVVIFLLNRLILGHKFFKDNSNGAMFLPVIITGFILAVFVEKYALVMGWWTYNSIMPIIPLLNVGLTPILQMMVVPLILFLSFQRHLRRD
jgi:hypothetical protein